MIASEYIEEWARFAPWRESWQVEQDLVITYALLKIYGHEILRQKVAFRGGTALNKLFMKPAFRYSEDIDLVQINAEPIGETIDLIRVELKSLLGEPQRILKTGLVTLVYRNTYNDGSPLKLKIEINTREHFAYLGLEQYVFRSESSFYGGEVSICSYKIEELLATKMRALYQRRKGRDLFDLYEMIVRFNDLDFNAIVGCFEKYMQVSGMKISQKLFRRNVEDKLKYGPFLEDVMPLLPNQESQIHPDIAYRNVLEKLIARMN